METDNNYLCLCKGKWGQGRKHKGPLPRQYPIADALTARSAYRIPGCRLIKTGKCNRMEDKNLEQHPENSTENRFLK